MKQEIELTLECKVGSIFKQFSSSSDIPHAISAFVYNAKATVAYDDHFKDISDVIPYVKPEEIALD